MSERTPMDTFEQRIAGLARAYTEPAARPVDPLATARAAMRAPTSRWVPFERMLRPSIDRRLLLLLVAAGLVIALAALALAAGTMLRPRDTGPGRIVFVRDGDLFVSAIDGTGVARIREGGANETELGYLMALWSPDMRHIAAVRDLGGPVLTPAVEILGPDGTVQRTIDAGPGGTPSMSWSPDGTRLAIATYPADVARDAADPIAVGPRLTIAALDGRSQEIALPSDAVALAFALPEIWTVADLSVRWSPDGRWIAVRWDPAGPFHLVSADGSNTGRLRDLTEGRCRAFADYIDWFPDGHRLATVGEWVYASELCVEAVAPGGRPEGPAPASGTVAATPQDDPVQPHYKFNMPAVSPGGDRIAISTFTDDFELGRHATSLRVIDLVSSHATDVASGVETLVLEANGAVHAKGTLEGNPVGWAGFAWTADGRRLLYLSPEPGDGPKRWTIRAVDAAGGSQSSVVLEGVRSFDLGYLH